MKAKEFNSTKKETVIELDDKRQVRISEFMGKNRIDIREYYIDKASGEKKPSKKGISLTEESWRGLVDNFSKIDEGLRSFRKDKSEEKEDKDNE